MTAPTLSISVHHDFTPGLRDRILDQLRQRMDDPSYRLLTPLHLRALAEIESPAAPILSLYLQLTPERRVGGAWRAAFASLVDSAEKRLADPALGRRLRAEAGRVEQALAAELPRLGRGAAFFVCEPAGLWRQIALSVPLPDRIHFGPRLYLRPLVRTRDEHDRFVLALLSRERSRFFASQIGQAEEVYRVKGPRLRGMLTDRVPRDRRDVLATQVMKDEARLLARVAELVFAQFEARYLLVSAPPELRTAFAEALPKAIQAQLGPPFEIDAEADLSAVAAAAGPVQRMIEAREEVATLRRMIDAGPGQAAWGVQAVLDLLCEGRVMTLAVEDADLGGGASCGGCGALFAAAPGRCPACGGESEAVDDIVEAALERALAQGARIELVRSDEARRLMAARAPMAALLRW